MNSEFLSDILECSVCLKPLDDQNKVLPCQHTFCKSCLQSIVKSHKELRCPECRVVVRQRVDDLPSNILLIRLLDGIRNQKRIIKSTKQDTRRHSVEGILSEPIPASGGAKDGGVSSLETSLPPTLHERTNSEPVSNKNKVTTSRPCASAIYAYKSEEPNDLSFEKGDIIYLLKKVDKNWMNGECHGNIGVFPVNHVRILQPLSSERPCCVALYDFESDPQEPDRDCLHFAKNDHILVLRKVDNNWAEGVLKEKIGIFPLSFVELNDEAQKIIDDSPETPPGSVVETKPQRVGGAGAAARRISSNKQGGKNTKKRHSFPTFQAGKAKDDESPTSTFRHSVELGNSSIPIASNNLSRTENSLEEQRSGSQTNESGPGTDSPSSAVRKLDPLIQNSVAPNTSSRNGNVGRDGFLLLKEQKSIEKSRSEKQDTSFHVPSSTNAFPSKGSAGRIVNAAFSYKSQKSDELDLVKGDSYRITEVCLDGWCRGSHLRTGKSGVFPGNYITPKSTVLSTSKSSPNTPRYDKSMTPSTSELSGPATERTYKQFRQLQLKLLRNLDSSKQDSSKSSISANLSLSPPQNGSRPTKPLLPTSKSSNSMARSSQESAPCPSTRCSSATPRLSEEIKSPTARAPSKSSLPARPAPPSAQSIAAKSASQNSDAFSSKQPRPALNHSTSFESKSPSTSSVVRSLTKETRKQSDKDKKRGKGMLSKVLSAGSIKPKSSASKSPTSSPSASSHHSGLQVALPHHSKPTVKPLLRDRYYATMNYPASDPEELDLRENDIVIVYSRRPDGWFKGSNLRSGLVGHFPSTFVERIPQ